MSKNRNKEPLGVDEMSTQSEAEIQLVEGTERKIAKYAFPISFVVFIIAYYFFYKLIYIIWKHKRPVHAFLLALTVWVLVWYYIRTGELKSFFGQRMTIYIVRRLLAMIPIFLGISIITFAMLNMVGDPVQIAIGQSRIKDPKYKEYLRKKFGLDKPPYMRYLIWLKGFITGDLGTSIYDNTRVETYLKAMAWETLKLQFVGFFIGIVIAIPLGVWAAKYMNTGIDITVSTIALLGLSMPIFVTGILLIYIFGQKLPTSGAHSVNAPWFPDDNYWELIRQGLIITAIKNFIIITADSIKHLILPSITLAFAGMASYTRIVRSSMLEILRQDFILAARANGLPEQVITWKHAFRNATIPVATFVGLFLGGALAGAPITETVFSWPGLGQFYIIALGRFDYPILLGLNMIITLLILTANLLTDIAYVYLDPRIKL